MFKDANTEGFTAEELATLNQAREELLASGILEIVPDDHLDDLINNAWQRNCDAEELVGRVRRRASW